MNDVHTPDNTPPADECVGCGWTRDEHPHRDMDHEFMPPADVPNGRKDVCPDCVAGCAGPYNHTAICQCCPSCGGTGDRPAVTDAYGYTKHQRLRAHIEAFNALARGANAFDVADAALDAAAKERTTQ